MDVYGWWASQSQGLAAEAKMQKPKSPDPLWAPQPCASAECSQTWGTKWNSNQGFMSLTWKPGHWTLFSRTASWRGSWGWAPAAVSLWPWRYLNSFFQSGQVDESARSLWGFSSSVPWSLIPCLPFPAMCCRCGSTQFHQPPSSTSCSPNIMTSCHQPWPCGSSDPFHPTSSLTIGFLSWLHPSAHSQKCQHPYLSIKWESNCSLQLQSCQSG